LLLFNVSTITAWTSHAFAFTLTVLKRDSQLIQDTTMTLSLRHNAASSSLAMFRIALVSVIALAAGLAQAQVNTAAILSAEILNLSTPAENVFASGQPSQDQLQVLAKSGVKHIISLRPASETDWDEAELARSLGMEFHNIPVAGADDVTSENARKLQELLSSLEGQPTLVHCASSNRVGALRALIAAESGGEPLESAISTGKAWGLTSLEPAVRAALSK
jgi:uncharacterized protein (TIGR01244 family)